MIRCLATKVLEKEALKKYEENKKVMMYAGITVLAGIGAYFSYKAIKNYMYDRELYDDLEYLESMDDTDEEENENEYTDKELKEKVDEFNSRRLSYENDEIVSPKELNHYIDQIKVDKDKYDINEENFEEGKYEKYDE